MIVSSENPAIDCQMQSVMPIQLKHASSGLVDTLKVPTSYCISFFYTQVLRHECNDVFDQVLGVIVSLFSTCTLTILSEIS
jgi:hypothetical protein